MERNASLNTSKCGCLLLRPPTPMRFKPMMTKLLPWRPLILYGIGLYQCNSKRFKPCAYSYDNQAETTGNSGTASAQASTLLSGNCVCASRHPAISADMCSLLLQTECHEENWAT